jgi:hypothetical protein
MIESMKDVEIWFRTEEVLREKYDEMVGSRPDPDRKGRIEGIVAASRQVMATIIECLPASHDRDVALSMANETMLFSVRLVRQT